MVLANAHARAHTSSCLSVQRSAEGYEREATRSYLYQEGGKKDRC
jgi:hypothetical protein